MKRIILAGAMALLAACGSSGNSSSSGSATTAAASVTTAGSASNTAPAATSATSGTDATATTISGTGDTITIDNFGDMPPKCIELLSSFLKKIEPAASAIQWDKATLRDFEAFTDKYKTESDAFDTETAAAGCNKYNLSGSDSKQFEQMAQLASTEAPGTLGFINFLGALSANATATAGSVPADCAGTIAAIEPYLTKGVMKDLTMAEVTKFGQLMSAVSNVCNDTESSAFFARDDVNAFIKG